MSDEITIAEAIGSLREQIIQAMEQGKGQPLKFEASAVEVELAVTFRKERDGRAGLQLLSFVNLSAGGKRGQENTLKVKLQLQPTDLTGKRPEISDNLLPKN
jgi:hypothetical protein